MRSAPKTGPCSLTTFNVLFKSKEDHFIGQKGGTREKSPSLFPPSFPRLFLPGKEIGAFLVRRCYSIRPSSLPPERRTPIDTKPITVLLIEDEASDMLLIQRDLNRAVKVPFEMVHADRLKSGLERLQKGGVDVVLLDLNLPDGQGLGTLEQVEAQAPHVPVIVLTGDDDDDVAVEAVHRGAQDYLVKGQVAGGLLRRAIRYAIERKKLLTEIERTMKEVKTLRGFLPICANCKKIRDDKGYWTRIETYISEHSGAEFTHGLCPECATKLYGLQYDKKT